MDKLHTNQICTMTELREPQKVLDKAGGKPVAVMKNSKCVAYLVPEEATLQGEARAANMDDVAKYIAKNRARTQPVLDYLKDK